MKTILKTALTAMVAFLLGAVQPAHGNAVSIAPIPTLGGTFSQPTALSAGGQVTGFSQTAGDAAMHAFVYDGGSTASLGTLGGSMSQGTAINSLGQVAGDSSIAGDITTHAFFYDGANMIDLGTLGGSFSSAVAINDAGQVTGTSAVPGDAGLEVFLYVDGVLTGLGHLGGGFSIASGINNHGHVIGNSFTASFEPHAFVYRDGTMHDLGTLGGGFSSATAINDSGTVIGWSLLSDGSQRAFVHVNGTMTDLGTLGGGFSSATAINEAGQIIGMSQTAAGTLEGYLYQSGAMLPLGTLGGSYSDPSDINDLGQIVGESATAGGLPHAFLWENGTMIDLNDVLPPDSGWELYGAYFINNSGRIVGIGIYNGSFQWFVLDRGNNPPVAVAGADQTVNCGTSVTLDGTASTDPDGDELSFEWSENGIVLSTESSFSTSFDLGVHVITLKVTDPSGASAESNVTITVQDITAPTIHSLCASPNVLSPPNHRLVPVQISIDASDLCDLAPVSRIVSITSNEPVADGDIQITGDLTALLAASRNPAGPGRVYSITVECVDASGNSSSGIVPVTVPKGSTQNVGAGGKP